MKIYTIAQIAEILSVHDRTVRRLIDSGDLKAVKVGTNWRITEDDLRTYLEENKTGGKGDSGGK